MSFGVGSLIWAKMKGYPHWPARVESAMGDSKKPRKYKVFFFGTHELGYVTAKEMFPYDPNKEKFSKPLKNRGYQEALQEIEFNPNLERTEEEEYRGDESPDDEKELRIVVKGEENEEKLERRQRVKRNFELEDETSSRDTATKKTKEEDEGWETPDETIDAGAAEGSDEDFEIRAQTKKSSLSPPPPFPAPLPPLRENAAEWRQTVSKNLAALAERKRQKRENEQLIQQLSKLNLNLKMSLTVEAPDISRCLRVLSAISVLPVTKTLLRDFPDIVTTLRKVRKYKASETVMSRAGPLYEKFRAIFCSDDEEEDNPEVRHEDVVACETNE